MQTKDDLTRFEYALVILHFLIINGETPHIYYYQKYKFSAQFPVSTCVNATKNSFLAEKISEVDLA